MVVGTWIAIAGLLGIIIFPKIKVKLEKKIPQSRLYNLKVTNDVLGYFCEIAVMFGLFTMLISNQFYTTDYALKETNMLKQFIDFFTIYQIGVVVVLKLITAHYVEECKTLLSTLSIMRSQVEKDESLDAIIPFLEEYEDAHIPLQIRDIYEQLSKRANNYEVYRNAKHLDSVDLEGFKNAFIGFLYSYEMLANGFMERKESELEVSLLLRYRRERSRKQ